MIDIQHLKFKYAPQSSFQLVLDEFRVGAGERAVLYGPSGCGKSTLLQIIAGELCPQSGTVQICNVEMSKTTEDMRRAFRIQNIGFVFQDFPLVDYLTTLENVLLAYRIHPSLALDDDVKARAGSLLNELGIGDKSNCFPSALSQGERQRVAIARALIAQPILLLADEPTAGLDPKRSQQVLDLLFKIVDDRGLTLVLVSHDPHVRARFTQQIPIGVEHE